MFLKFTETCFTTSKLQPCLKVYFLAEYGIFDFFFAFPKNQQQLGEYWSLGLRIRVSGSLASRNPSSCLAFTYFACQLPTP